MSSGGSSRKASWGPNSPGQRHVFFCKSLLLFLAFSSFSINFFYLFVDNDFYAATFVIHQLPLQFTPRRPPHTVTPKTTQKQEEQQDTLRPAFKMYQSLCSSSRVALYLVLVQCLFHQLKDIAVTDVASLAICSKRGTFCGGLLGE